MPFLGDERSGAALRGLPRTSRPTPRRLTTENFPVLSPAERKLFDAICRAAARDPHFVAVTRATARRFRRRRILRWLAPWVMAAREARYARRLAGQTR